MLDPNFWREKLAPHTRKSNAIAARQVLLTLIPLMLLWAGYAYCMAISRWFAVPFCLLVTLFVFRCFCLMHDCGHNSLFESKRANQIVGFLFGVITGMPQAVWSKNHAYHHATNGDWVKYGGMLNIISTDQYARLSERDQRRYQFLRHPMILVPAGFVYVLFNPRFNWILGNLVMLAKIVGQLVSFKLSLAVDTAKKWESKFWKSKEDYRHQTYNNVVLLCIWVLMCKAIGTADFFLLYAISTSAAGSLGILLFATQHNFEDSYATDTVQVDYYRAALEGTSMLVLPKVLQWFMADINIHHVHHLSVAVPNYRLAACHQELESLFVNVKRVQLREVLTTFDYQLWDPKLQKVVARNTSRQA